MGYRTGFAATSRLCHHDLRVHELFRLVGPAPLLGTAYGNDDLGLAGNEHGGVEDAILLGPHQFLAIQQEHVFVT